MVDTNFKRLMQKLQPYKGPSEYVSDPYDQNALAEEVSDSSLQLSPEDVHKILNAESTGGQNLQNPDSSAKGNFQIIDKTRNEAIEELKKQGNTDFPANPLRLDAMLMKHLVGKSENALLNSQNGPKDPNLENMYLAHHFGNQGALDTLNHPEKPSSKYRLRKTGAQLAKKPLTTKDDGQPAKNLLDLLKE